MAGRRSPLAGGVVAHGWIICFHPLFRAQLAQLRREVESIKLKTPAKHASHKKTKRLSVIERLVFDTISKDPTRPEYHQGATLGKEYQHWLRAKFFQQYRLFFRYHTGKKVIVFAWVNDEQTKRAYKSNDTQFKMQSERRPDLTRATIGCTALALTCRSDRGVRCLPCVQEKLLQGNPPDNWDALIHDSKKD